MPCTLQRSNLTTFSLREQAASLRTLSSLQSSDLYLARSRMIPVGRLQAPAARSEHHAADVDQTPNSQQFARRAPPKAGFIGIARGDSVAFSCGQTLRSACAAPSFGGRGFLASLSSVTSASKQRICFKEASGIAGSCLRLRLWPSGRTSFSDYLVAIQQQCAQADTISGYFLMVDGEQLPLMTSSHVQTTNAVQMAVVWPLVEQMASSCGSLLLRRRMQRPTGPTSPSLAARLPRHCSI
mmetsp:Transcript_42723/g.100171  ORF Transcript_42723/g.100171 Transcript_42723/m.100171 type:complete len:240 (-) Transcript_42723:2185-2904(-)